ncbi:MAG: hypothetical protein KA436_09045 [Oligoflexales bacterium]|nr:hypothetical protein [Oligoflexales bacterium]
MGYLFSFFRSMTGALREKSRPKNRANQSLFWLSSSQRPLSVLALLSLSCDSSLVPKGSSILSRSNVRSSTFEMIPENARSAFHVQALQIGSEMLADMKTNLVENTSLREDQVDIVLQTAKSNLIQHVNKLIISDLHFDLNSPLHLIESAETIASDTPLIFVVAPSITKSAMDSLLDERVVSTSSEQRGVLATGLIKSTFVSLKGRTDSLQESEVSGVAQKMIGSAVSSFQSVGFSQGNASIGTKAITEGAIGALQKSGIKSDSVATVAQAMVSSVVANLKSIDVSPEQMVQAIGSAASGAVGAIKNLGVDKSQGSTLAGQFAAATISGIKDLQLDASAVRATMKDVSRQVVSSLTKAELGGDSLGQSVNSITSAMVSSIGTNQFDKSVINDSVQSILSGTISGIGEIGLSNEQLKSSGVIKEAMKGTVSSMGKTGLATSDVATSMQDLMSGAVASLSQIQGTKNQSSFNGVLTDMMSGSMESLKTAGMGDVSSMSLAVQRITKGIVSALPQADQGGGNSSSVAEMSYFVTQTSMGILGKMDLGSTSDLKALTGSVSQGASESIAYLGSSGVLSQEAMKASTLKVSDAAMASLANLKSSGQITASDYAAFSTTITNKVFDGLAQGGVGAEFIQNVHSGVQSAVSSQLQGYGVSAAEISNLQSTLTSHVNNSVTFAQNLDKGSFVTCADFADSLSDNDFVQKSSSQTDPFMCQPTAVNLCPKRRVLKDSEFNWFYRVAGDKAFCERNRIYFNRDNSVSSSSSTSTSSPTGSTTTGVPIASNPTGSGSTSSGASTGTNSTTTSTGSAPTNTNTGTAPTNTGTAPTNTGTAPTNTGTAPTNTGTAPTNTGTNPTQTGTGAGTTNPTSSPPYFSNYQYIVKKGRVLEFDIGGGVAPFTFGVPATVQITELSRASTFCSGCRAFSFYSNDTALNPADVQIHLVDGLGRSAVATVDIRGQGEFDSDFGFFANQQFPPAGSGLYYPSVSSASAGSPLKSLFGDILVQSDGKLMLAGMGLFSDTTPPSTQAVLINYDQFGNLANGTFPGTLVSNFGRPAGEEVQIFNSALGSLGKIYLVGRLILKDPTTGASLSGKALVVRLLSNGTQDSSFGTNGLAVIDLSTSTAGRYDSFYSAAVVQNGSIDEIYLGGATDVGNSIEPTGPTSNRVLVKLNNQGQLLTSWGLAGKANWNTTNPLGVIRDIKIVTQSPGFIVAGGHNHLGQWSVSRFNMGTGVFHSSFDDNFGANTAPYILGDVRKLRVYPDGRVLAVGMRQFGTPVAGNTDYEWVVSRFLSSTGGSLNKDTSFASGGMVTRNMGPGQDSAYAVDLQDDGKILVVGTGKGNENTQTPYHGIIMRLTDTGQFDSSFYDAQLAMPGQLAFAAVTGFSYMFNSVYFQAFNGNRRIIILGNESFNNNLKPIFFGMIP